MSTEKNRRGDFKGGGNMEALSARIKGEKVEKDVCYRVRNREGEKDNRFPQEKYQKPKEGGTRKDCISYEEKLSFATRGRREGGKKILPIP